MLQCKIAIYFKDQSVFQVFQISLTSPHQLKNDGNTLIFILEWYLCIFFSLKGFIPPPPPKKKKSWQQIAGTSSFTLL